MRVRDSSDSSEYFFVTRNTKTINTSVEVYSREETKLLGLPRVLLVQ